MNITDGTKENWAEQVGRKGSTLVLFRADYSAAAKRYQEMLDRVADASGIGSRVRLVLVDVDVQQELAIDHGLRGVPTLCVYRDGGLCETFLGGRGLRETEALLQRLYPED